jgi:hypothetical protein
MFTPGNTFAAFVQADWFTWVASAGTPPVATAPITVPMKNGVISDDKAKVAPGARLTQQLYLKGSHHRWISHDLDLGDGSTDHAESEDRPDPPAGGPHRARNAFDECHLGRCRPP